VTREEDDDDDDDDDDDNNNNNNTACYLNSPYYDALRRIIFSVLLFLF